MASNDNKAIRSTTSSMAGALVGATAGVVIAGPPGAFLGAAIAPAMERVLSTVMDRIQKRWTQRISYVLSAAAEAAGIDADTLVGRLEGDPQREELLVAVLRAAQDSALEPKLVALATSLASGATTNSPTEISLEAALVHALASLEQSHMDLLAAFVKTQNELGLGDGSSDFDSVAQSLNHNQLVRALPHLSGMIEPTLAVVEGQGLLRASTATGGMVYQISSEQLLWALTPFGSAFLERMKLVGESLAPAD